MKKLFFHLAFLALFLIQTQCSSFNSKPSRTPSSVDEFTLTPSDSALLLSTTDFHGHLEQAEPLAYAVRTIREKYPKRTLHFDSGDFFQGTLESNLSKGKSVIDFFNLIKLDAAAMGNHDIDYGSSAENRIQILPNEDELGNIKDRSKQAQFPILSSNILSKCKGFQMCSEEQSKNAEGIPTFLPPNAIFEVKGHKLCTIGATTPSTPFITNPMFVKNITFKPLKESVLKEAIALREKGCERIVLVSHAGLECPTPTTCQTDSEKAEILHLLKELPKGTLDAVLAGHTHKLAQEVIEGTPVLESGSYGTHLGALELFWDKPHGSHFKFHPFFDLRLISPNDEVKEKVQDVTKVLSSYRNKSLERKKVPLFETSDAFPKNYDTPTALGNMIAKSTLKYKKKHLIPTNNKLPVISFLNAGGVRNSLPKGIIDYGTFYSVLPFDNSIVVSELKGKELLTFFEIATSRAHGHSIFSGVQFEFLPDNEVQKRDLNGDGNFEKWEESRIAKIMIEGKELHLEASYLLVTSDFIALGGDHQAYFFNKVPNERKKFFAEHLQREGAALILSQKKVLRPEDYLP